MSEPKATACVPAWAADPELVVAIEAFYGHCAETGAEQEAEPRPLAVGLGGWLADYTAKERRIDAGLKAAGFVCGIAGVRKSLEEHMRGEAFTHEEVVAGLRARIGEGKGVALGRLPPDRTGRVTERGIEWGGLTVGLGGWLADYTARVRREGGEDAKTELLRLIGEYGEAREAIGMRFGEKIRELRKAKLLGQRALADMVGVSFTYVSKVENEKLDFGDYPSEDLIRRLAEALDADADELLLLAKKIPEEIKSRVLERPDAFRKIAKLDDAELDDLLREIDRREQDK